MKKKNSIISRYYKFVILLVLSIIGGKQVMAQPLSQPFDPLFKSRKQEVRAVWLTTIRGLDWPDTKATSPATIARQKQELIDILDELERAKVNMVLLQTRVRGNLIYPSVYESWCEAMSGKGGVSPGYDPLAFAIEECHKRGMEIHAWMVAIPLGSDKVHKELGSASIVKRNPKICKSFNGNWYLNPGHPETKNYMAALTRELVTNYDIDGVHLDYIRYPDRPLRFPDVADFRKYGDGRSLQQWRRDNITEIVRAIYEEVKSVKPWVKVSSAPLGKYKDTKRYPSRGWNAYYTVYQEAQRWMKEGIQDILFPMLYYRDHNFYPFVLDWHEQSNGRMVVPGLGIYFMHPSEGDWPLDEIERQLNFIRWNGVDGEAHFRSRFLTENTAGLLDKLNSDYYYAPALVPPMTWIDSIPPLKPEAVSLEVHNTDVRLVWHPSYDNIEGGVYYNVYRSENYPVDITDSKNLLAVRLRDTLYTYTPLVPEEQEHYYAVTALDRCGNESEPLFFNRTVEIAAHQPADKYIWDGEQLKIIHVSELLKEVRDMQPKRLVPDDGIITLPENVTGKSLVVTDLTKRPIATLAFSRYLRINKLADGCYWIFVQEEDRPIRKVGMFVKD